MITALDSGADVSVAPKEFYDLGAPGTSRPMRMMDTPGERIHWDGNWLIATAKDGSNVEFVEKFARGQGGTHPFVICGREIAMTYFFLTP